MRRRTLQLTLTIGGMPIALGEVLIDKFAKMREDWKDATKLVCPDCKETPDWVGYNCLKCDKTYASWMSLKRVYSDTGEPFERERLVPKAPKGKKARPVKAQLYRMEVAEFTEKYADATLTEAGLTVRDVNSAQNLQKLVVAVERLGQVIVLRWPDTYEQRVALLTVSMSNRILLREIIPSNLLIAEETARVDMSSITEKDIEEAKALISQIPEATEETFIVDDFRAIGVEVPVKMEAPKVQALAEILAKVQAS